MKEWLSRKDLNAYKGGRKRPGLKKRDLGHPRKAWQDESCLPGQFLTQMNKSPVRTVGTKQG